MNTFIYTNRKWDEALSLFLVSHNGDVVARVWAASFNEAEYAAGDMIELTGIVRVRKVGQVMTPSQRTKVGDYLGEAREWLNRARTAPSEGARTACLNLMRINRQNASIVRGTVSR